MTPTSEVRLKLSPGVLTLIWSILLAVIGLSGFMARLDARVGEQSEAVRLVVTKLEKHVEAPWHGPAAVRYDAIEGRIQRLEMQRR